VESARPEFDAYRVRGKSLPHFHAQLRVLVRGRLLGVCRDPFLDRFRCISRGFCPLGRGILVLVRVTHLGLSPGLDGFSGSSPWILAVVLLLLNDFLIVSDVAGIRHVNESPLVVAVALPFSQTVP